MPAWMNDTILSLRCREPLRFAAKRRTANDSATQSARSAARTASAQAAEASADAKKAAMSEDEAQS
jgi:hypothetical protein